MAKIISPKIRFKPSTSPDVVSYAARVAPDYVLPVVNLGDPPVDTDGYVRVAVADIPFLAGVEGDAEVYITAVDDVGNESDFLRVAGPLDLSPPAAPTDGSF